MLAVVSLNAVNAVIAVASAVSLSAAIFVVYQPANVFPSLVSPRLASVTSSPPSAAVYNVPYVPSYCPYKVIFPSTTSAFAFALVTFVLFTSNVNAYLFAVALAVTCTSFAGIVKFALILVFSGFNVSPLTVTPVKFATEYPVFAVALTSTVAPY